MKDSTPTPPPAPPKAPATTAHNAKGWTVFSERGEDMAGAVLGGRFEIEKRIGRGGMAEVFVSKDLLLHGLAAVKVLREGNIDARRRFADEGQLLANLRDPHLVRVLAVGETEDGAPYMALEYLDGPSLEGRLRVGPLPWREVIDLAGQVAGALAALDGATGWPVAKLIDLGIAKVFDWSRAQGGGVTTSWQHKMEITQVSWLVPRRAIVTRPATMRGTSAARVDGERHVDPTLSINEAKLGGSTMSPRVPCHSMW